MKDDEMPATILKQRPAEFDDTFSRIAGALLSAAAADALGWITEFVRGRDHLVKLYKTDFVSEYRAWQKTSGGRFNAYVDYISKGEYSDDTQLTLAVARSLDADGTIDIEHFSKIELPLWLDYARGAGATITAGARAIGRKSAAWNRNFFAFKRSKGTFSYREAGANGAAMRVGPIALANIANPTRMKLGVWMTSIVTHGHPRAILGALTHAEALRFCAQQGRTTSEVALLQHLLSLAETESVPNHSAIEEWIRMWNADVRIDFQEHWENTKRELRDGLQIVAAAKGAPDVPRLYQELGCFSPASKGSGIATVLAGLLVFSTTGVHDLREAVLTAVNQLGSDTDTIGGFVGAMSGAVHGYEALPHEWAVELQDYDYFMRLATELSRINSGEGLGGKALLPEKKGLSADLPDLLESLRSSTINKNERVYHPLFGAGWVESVDAQSLRRRDGARAVFVQVRFDVGQSCKFRYMDFPKRHGLTQQGPSPKKPTRPGKLF